jgi:hypothetical protein
MHSAQSIEHLGVPMSSQKIVPGATATGIAPNVLTYQRFTVAFTLGGTVVLNPGDTIVGLVSGATADIVSINITSGAFGTSDAAGTMVLDNYIGTFNSDEVVSTRGGANDATATTLTLVPVVDTSDFFYKGAAASAAIVQALTQTALFNIDGTNPDQSVKKGFQLSAGSSYTLTSPEAVRQFRVLDATNGSATTVNVICFF